MRVLRCAAAFVLAALISLPAWAQGTGAAYPTPNGQPASGSVVLVPCGNGNLVNGQPVVCPPGPLNAVPVQCENCSPSAPTGASSNPVNGTVAVTNTFQSLLALNASRKSCTIQNQGSHVMYFSIAGSPSLANSQQVFPGGSYVCVSPGSNVVSTDAVQVTGTSGDAFAGDWQ